MEFCPKLQYRHAGGPPKDEIGERECIVQQYEWLRSDDVVIDRVTSISQRVYNPDPVLDGVREVSFENLRRAFDPILIYCRPTTDRLLRGDALTWREGESEEHKQKILNNLHTFVQRYDDIMQRTPHITYDFDDEVASKKLIERIGHANRGDMGSQAWLYDLMNWGVGK
jgi:hypothetical protein